MADIFLSYDKDDVSRVKPLVKVFKRRGWDVWWDRTILPSQRWEQVIGDALDEARCVVVVWSQHAVKSKWVRDEASEGRDRNILVPVLIDEVKIPFGFRSIQAARLVDWQGGKRTHPELKNLLEAIRKTLASSAPAGETPPPQQKTETHERKSEADTDADSSAKVTKKPAFSGSGKPDKDS